MLFKDCKTRRTNSGGALVEGVVALALVIAGAVAGTLLLVNAGTAMYLKNKVEFTAEQIAKYAASESDGSKRNTFNQDLISKMGLAAGTTVQLESIQVGGQDAVKATVSSSVNTIGKVDFLPQFVSMNDSAIAITGGGMGIEGYLYVPTTLSGFMQQGGLACPLVKLPALVPLGQGKPAFMPIPASHGGHGFTVVTPVASYK